MPINCFLSFTDASQFTLIIQTLLLQCNTQNSTVCTPKQIYWNDIVLPSKLTLENLIHLPKV
jgi:hypothetical protein